MIFLIAARSIAGQYGTDFPLQENPLNQNGIWTYAPNTGWTELAVTNTGGANHAYLLQTGAPYVYDDSLATLMGMGLWGNTQQITLTVFDSNPLRQDPQSREIEYGFGTVTNGYWTGVLADALIATDTGYCEIGINFGGMQYPNHWPGPGNPPGWTNWSNLDVYSNGLEMTNGATIVMQKTNNVYTIFFNGIFVLSATNTFGVGPTEFYPVIGGFHQEPGHQPEWGIRSFNATDFTYDFNRVNTNSAAELNPAQ